MILPKTQKIACFNLGSTSNEIISKEWWGFIGLFLLLGCIFFALSLVCLALLSWAIGVLGAYLGYNQERIPKEIGEEVIISPVDGVIKAITPKKYGVCVEIVKPICFNGILRIPFVSHISIVEDYEGLRLGNNILNQKCKLKFETQKHSIQMEIFPRYFKNSLFLYFNRDTIISTHHNLNGRFGFLRSGIVRIYFSHATALRIAEGDRIKAGESILGYAKEETNEN